jgi:carbamoyltransferase
LEEKILVLTCDGAGDGICASVNIGLNGVLQRLAAVEHSASIGRLYSTITYLLGMVPLEHEYKLMGLAPYAEGQSAARAIARRFSELFEFDRANPMVWRRAGCPPLQDAREFIEALIRLQRFDHIAAGLQLFTESFLVQWVTNCIRETGIRKVALSGGVFMNVKANQKILQIPELEELFVFPSCGDETNSIGAGFFQCGANGGRPRPLQSLYLGPQFTADDVEAELSRYPFQNRVRIEEPPDIEFRTAELIAQRRIVARFKGREEFGARALGNRSILADASDPAAVKTINHMIKSRDFWMPFAPSVLAQRSADYFSKSKPMAAPYMIVTFDALPNRVEKMVAVLHPADLTGRPQEVYEQWNPSYYELLKNYEAITGEGIILNTSFNLHGEPIVSSPRDALRVFDLSGLTCLAIERFLLTKE